MSSRSLRLYSPVVLGTPVTPISGGDVTERAKGWSRSIRRDGGYWMGSFFLPINQPGDVKWATTWFYEYLGCHFEEKSEGFVTFEGLIYEMDLTIGGETKRRTFDRMRNHVTTKYIDEDGIVQTSDAVTQAQSIAKYGQREWLLLLDGYPQATAEGERDKVLVEYSWPRAYTTGVNLAEGDGLEVVVCGYVFTANWRYESVGDDTEDDLSAFLSELIAADCEFLRTGTIETNTYQVVKGPEIPMRVFELILEMVSLGKDDDPTRFFVDNDRRAYYRTIDTTPEYFSRGGKLYTSAGGTTQVNPWRIKPGVVRNMDYPVSKIEYGGWLEDARDYYISEVEVSDAGPVFKTDEFSESDLLADQLRYEKMLEELREERAENG